MRYELQKKKEHPRSYPEFNFSHKNTPFSGTQNGLYIGNGVSCYLSSTVAPAAVSFSFASSAVFLLT